MYRRSQWPRGLRRRSSAARLLRSWVRIPPKAWMFVCCECCVLSGRGLCDGLITRPEESYRLWRVVVCEQETSKMRRLKPATGLWKIQPKVCNARKTNRQTPCIYSPLPPPKKIPTNLVLPDLINRTKFGEKHKYVIRTYTRMKFICGSVRIIWGKAMANYP